MHCIYERAGVSSRHRPVFLLNRGNTRFMNWEKEEGVSLATDVWRYREIWVFAPKIRRV